MGWLYDRATRDAELPPAVLVDRAVGIAPGARRVEVNADAVKAAIELLAAVDEAPELLDRQAEARREVRILLARALEVEEVGAPRTLGQCEVRS